MRSGEVKCKEYSDHLLYLFTFFVITFLGSEGFAFGGKSVCVNENGVMQ